MKSFFQYTVITLIGVFFLYFAFKGTDWNVLIIKFRNTNYWWIAAGMIVCISSHFLRGLRAVMLYKPLGYKVLVKNSFYAVVIGYMMNYIIPRAGEVSRCAALKKTDDIPVEKSLGTVVTERVFDMAILMLIFASVFFLQFDPLSNFLKECFGANRQQSLSGLNLKIIFVAVIIAGVVIFFLVRKKFSKTPLLAKIIKLLNGFGEGLMSIRQIKNPLLFVFLSVAIWFCYVIMMYFCLFATKATQNLGFMECLTVFAIGTIGIVLPTPGAGAGTFHFAIMQSLLLFGVPEVDGIAYATIVHGIQMIIILAIGFICSMLVLAMHKKKVSYSNFLAVSAKE